MTRTASSTGPPASTDQTSRPLRSSRCLTRCMRTISQAGRHLDPILCHSTSSCSNRRFRRTPATSSGCAPIPALRLHLVKPLGFRLDAKSVRRAGLDYHELADVHGPRRLRRLPRERSRAAALVRILDTRHAPPRRGARGARATCWCSARKRADCRRRCWPRVARERMLRIPMPPAIAQPQSLECGGRGGVRSVAPVGIRRGGRPAVTPRPQSFSVFTVRCISAMTASLGASPSYSTR